MVPVNSVQKRISAQKFWADLKTKSAREGIPIKATFELTYQCNLVCRHCYISEKRRSGFSKEERKELSYSEICSILNQLAELGCFHINLTGGEPLVRPDFFRILAYAKRKGFYVILQTNATLLTPRFVESLKETGVDQVDVSLYGMTPSVYEAITQIPGSFEFCMDGILLLQKKRINMTIKMMIMTYNLAEFDRFKTFAIDRSVRFQWDYLIHPRLDGSNEPLRYRISPEEAVKLEIENNPPLSDDVQYPREIKESFQDESLLFNCAAGRNSLSITPYGEMNLCLECRIPGYDLRKGSVAEGWRELTEFVKSKKPDSSFQCRNCELEQYCFWCPSVGLLEEGNMSSCSSYYKELAGLRKERANS